MVLELNLLGKNPSSYVTLISKMETSTSLVVRFGNDYRLGRYHVCFPRSQCHFRVWLCNYVQDRKSPLSINSSSSANKMMTILVTSVLLCPKYL